MGKERQNKEDDSEKIKNVSINLEFFCLVLLLLLLDLVE